MIVIIRQPARGAERLCVMAPRLAALLLFILTAANAQNFGIVAVDPVGLTNLALNADASEVFFGARRMPDGSIDSGINLYRANVATRTVTKLTNYSTDGVFKGVTRIAYPGTGTRLAYSYGDTGNPTEEQIHVFDTATGVDQNLYSFTTECPRVANANVWNPCISALHMAKDGTILYYSFRSRRLTVVKPDGAAKDLGIHQGDIGTSGRRVISDAGQVVFISEAPSGPTLVAQARDIYVVNLDGTGLKQVTHLPLPEGAAEAVISADGSRIAFTRTFGQPGRLGDVARSSEVWTVRTDGADLRRLSDGTESAGGPMISADGSTVIYRQDLQVKMVTTLLDPLALFRIVDVTDYADALASSYALSDDGKKAGVLLGPPFGQPTSYPGAIHIIDAAPDRPVKFSDGNQIFAPRFIYPLGIRSAAFFGTPSLGSLMTAFSYNLTQRDLTVATPTLPAQLDGIELLLNGSPLPIQAVTPWQINAQIPQTVPPNDSAFAVRRDGVTSPEVRASIAMRDPVAIFTDFERIQAAAVYPGTATLADRTHPASAGQILELYSFGLGVTNPLVPAAVASPFSPPASTAVPPRIRIGGVEAEVLFAGLVPGLAGVYQVNIRVPQLPPPQGDFGNVWFGWRKVTWVAADGTETGNSGFYVQ